MMKKQTANKFKTDAVSVIVQKTGIGRSVAQAMFDALNTQQKSLIAPESRPEQIQQILNHPQPEPKEVVAYFASDDEQEFLDEDEQ